MIFPFSISFYCNTTQRLKCGKVLLNICQISPCSVPSVFTCVSSALMHNTWSVALQLMSQMNWLNQVEAFEKWNASTIWCFNWINWELECFFFHLQLKIKVNVHITSYRLRCGSKNSYLTFAPDSATGLFPTCTIRSCTDKLMTSQQISFQTPHLMLGKLPRCSFTVIQSSNLCMSVIDNAFLIVASCAHFHF